jgi:anti-sigma regulatory factor (Ser/Thr protein kinase)
MNLGESCRFTLLCAYRIDGVAGKANAIALEQVCALHSSVLDGPTRRDPEDRVMGGTEVRAQFPAHIEAPRAARHFVVDAMRQWGLDADVLDDAALVATELAANAVVHASSAFTVVLSTDHEVVRIAVEDAVPVAAALLIVRPGRGLGLIAGLSRRWGADVSTESKVIWSELGVSQIGPPSGRRDHSGGI